MQRQSHDFLHCLLGDGQNLTRGIRWLVVNAAGVMHSRRNAERLQMTQQGIAIRAPNPPSRCQALTTVLRTRGTFTPTKRSA